MVELTEAKSKQQADLLQVIRMPMSLLDEEYCRELAKEMNRQANMQDTISVLAPNQPLEKNKILRMKSQALIHLCDYIQVLKDCEELEQKMNKRIDMQQEIAKAFV